MIKHATVLAALQAATEGLLYPSETDAPVKAFAWAGDGAPTAAALASSRGLPADAAVETSTIGDEIGPLAGTDGGDDAPRWQAILDLVARDLEDVAVYRIGGPEVFLAIVGRTASGAWVGLETRAVET